MKQIWQFLSGKKTYIIATLLGVCNVGVVIGWWTWHEAAVVDSILAPFGLAFLRAGIDKGGQSDPK